MKRRLTTALAAVFLGSAFFVAAAVEGTARVGSAGALEFGRVRLTTGPELHYAAQGPAAGRAVILLHGYTDSWYSYADVLPLLPADWRVYAVTQRGHGDSEKPRGNYSLPAMGRDVIAFMDALGIERASIVGHSFGGMVAQHAVALAPERVERLVIIASATSGQAVPGMTDFQAAIHALSEPVPVQFAREFQESTIRVPLRPSFVDSVVAESAKLPLHVWKGIMDGMLASGPAPGLESADVPTLLLWPEYDSYMPIASQLELVDLLDARLIVYPDVGHALHWEAPAAAARDIVAFIDG